MGGFQRGVFDPPLVARVWCDDISGLYDITMLHVKVFTLPFSDRLAGFNDEPVQEFVRDKDVVEVRDRFFERDGIPYLALLIVYRAVEERELARPRAEAKSQAKEDWRAQLSDEEWPLFNALREWRGQRAKTDAVPPYVIATNREFVEIVKKRPDTLSHLSTVDGFGQAKLKRYGADILRLMAGQPPPKRDQPEGDSSPKLAPQDNRPSDSEDTPHDPGSKTP